MRYLRYSLYCHADEQFKKNYDSKTKRTKQAKQTKQTKQAFGDTTAAFGLEVAILKYVVAAALVLVTKYILEYVRYSDNILYSFQTLEEYQEVRKEWKKVSPNTFSP